MFESVMTSPSEMRLRFIDDMVPRTGMSSRLREIRSLNSRILECRRCPRLASYIRDVAHNKVRRFRDEEYHGRPLPGFGDVNARLMIVGLAPAAHGGNRTGRMFTGDSSGDWLARAMHIHGFASIPTSQSRDDGLVLKNAYVTAAVRCAPPQNKPTRKETDTCLSYLEQEREILARVTTILCLGRIAYEAVCRMYGVRPAGFGHNRLFKHESIQILTSYHPSRQNTQTGRLSWDEWSAVFARAKALTELQLL